MILKVHVGAIGRVCTQTGPRRALALRAALRAAGPTLRFGAAIVKRNTLGLDVAHAAHG